MNNEPVAWMTENGYLITKDENLANIIKEKGEEPIIPLYTHPAKTDRYIADLKNLVDAQGQDGTWNSDKYMLGLFNGLELALSIFESREPKFRELPAKTLTDEEIALVWDKFSALPSPKDIKDFARAILRKAGEK